MSESKHTPGPWSYKGGISPILAPDKIGIMSSQRLSSEVEANARLIAAAPEMLAFIESITNAFGPYPHLNGHTIVADAYRIASKARGES